MKNRSNSAARWFYAILMMLLVGGLPHEALAGSSSDAKRRLTTDDLFALESVGPPVISPDGESVAYTVGSIDRKKDTRKSAVWVVKRSGGEPRRMTAEDSDASAPRWSPDGTYLSFLSARKEGKTQVWTLNRWGGEALQRTEIEQGVTGYEWSPDGKRLVLVIKDPEPKHAGEAKKSDDGSAVPKPWVIDRLLFKDDGAGYLDRRRTHLYVFDLKSKELAQMTGGDFDDTEPAWSPDGRSIAFVSNRSENPDANYNTDIWLARADDPDPKRGLRQLTTSSGSDESPAWSPDGTRIAYVAVPNREELTWYAMERIAIVSAKGGEPTLLTGSVDRGVRSPRFAPDGKTIYFSFQDQRSTHLARIPVTGGDITRVIVGERCVDAYSIARDGTIVALVAEANTPGNLVVAAAGGLRRLTKHNNALLDRIELAEVESVTFPSADGTRIQGFIYKPPGFSSKKRYPTLLRIHGGPWAQYDYRFDFEAQLFAARGYVVVATNPRGSTGRGKDFRMDLWQSWGMREAEDVIAGVDHAIELGYADPDRLGVGGWSWGGILTNYVITQTDRFGAAVSVASYSLNLANYGHDLWQRWWERELGLPWEHRERWEKLSSFNRVQHIVTPTLWMGGQDDWNVPIVNSELMYQAMKRLGRETLLVIYPDQDHSISRPSFRKDLWDRHLAWYDKYLAK